MAEKTRRVITRDDLAVCELCEDYFCEFHRVHFFECDCVLEEWQDLDLDE